MAPRDTRTRVGDFQVPAARSLGRHVKVANVRVSREDHKARVGSQTRGKILTES